MSIDISGRQQWIIGLIIITISVLTCIYFALSFRGLFADGSFCIFQICAGDYSWYTNHDNPRRISYILQVFVPAIVAQRTHDIRTITFMHSLMSVLIPTVLWIWAIFLTRKETLLCVITICLFCFVFFGPITFSLGTHNISYALTACILIYGLRKNAMSLGSMLGVIILSLLLSHTYESTIFFCLFIIFVFIIKIYKNKTYTNKYIPWLLPFLIAICGYTSVYSLYIYLGDYFAPSKHTAFDFRNFADSFTFTCLFCSLIAVTMFVFEEKKKKIKYLFLTLATIILCLNFEKLIPFDRYQLRMVAGYAMFGVLSLYFIGLQNQHVARYIVKANTMKSTSLFSVPIMLLIFACLIDIRASYEHSLYIKNLHTEVNQPFLTKGLEEIPFLSNNANKKWGWAWTYPAMSQLLRSSREGSGIIINTQVPEYKWLRATLQRGALGEYFWGAND